MARHVHEKQEITINAFLKKGKPTDKKITFVFSQEGKEIQRVDGQLNAGDAKNAGKVASCKFTPPEVPKDKPKYLLEYYVIAEKEEYRNADEIQVWPQKGKLISHHDADDKPFPGVKFKVIQNRRQFGPVYKTVGDKAEVEFKLDKGYPFTIRAADPYEIRSKKETTLREITVKAVVHFEAEFVKPQVPKSGVIRQYVNLDVTAEKGRDGQGPSIVLQIGAKGDRDKGKTDLIGGPGVFAYVKVIFGPKKSPALKSKRNDPKTELVAGNNLKDLQTVTAQKEYKGKVELAKAGGIGEFEISLGKAGGDRCQVRIGGTPDCGSAVLNIDNWRRIWYELMAPEVMDFEEREVSKGVKMRDFKSAARDNMAKEGKKTFIEYEIHKSLTFNKARAEMMGVKGAFLKREFFELTKGPAEVYLLTDYTFTKYPKAFNKGRGKRGALIKACDKNLYNDGPARDADKTLDIEITDPNNAFFNTHARVYWSPVSAYKTGGGANGIREIKWEAKVDPNAVKVAPDVDFADVTPNPNAGDGNQEVVSIMESYQASPLDVAFVKGGAASIPTTISPSEKTKIKNFVKSLCTIPELKKTGHKVHFLLSGNSNNADGAARIEAVRQELIAQVAAEGKTPNHNGIGDDGAALKGDLPANTVDMDKSTHKKIVLKLPAAKPSDPGSLAGALNIPDKCPIKIKIKYEPQHSGLGLAGSGTQKGELLLVYGGDDPLCTTDTVLHELGHQYAMTPYNVAADGHAPGLRKPKSSTENEDVREYKKSGAKGHYYDNVHGHSGTHCAWGLSDADKGQASYEGKTGKCIMFGEGPTEDTKRKAEGFCPQCVDYIRARDLSELK